MCKPCVGSFLNLPRLYELYLSPSFITCIVMLLIAYVLWTVVLHKDVLLFSSKDVRLPIQLQRAMAAEAEAAREARAKVCVIAASTRKYLSSGFLT